MKVYQIKSIKHTGTKGEKGSDRTEKCYIDRIGKLVTFSVDNIKFNQSAVLPYIETNDDGKEIVSSNALITSRVRSVMSIADSEVNDAHRNFKKETVFITTLNSVFEFETVKHDIHNMTYA